MGEKKKEGYCGFSCKLTHVPSKENNLNPKNAIKLNSIKKKDITRFNCY